MMSADLGNRSIVTAAARTSRASTKAPNCAIAMLYVCVARRSLWNGRE
jgi:hypothetical protein